jgi:hypothetical protein
MKINTLGRRRRTDTVWETVSGAFVREYEFGAVFYSKDVPLLCRRLKTVFERLYSVLH